MNTLTGKTEQPIGAVMVLGGGIAGMQASLDLADQGFRVYLVEKQSAIGGKMAQLDKTFPTNDCAMCTISPKLVETGRHPNIHLMTNSELVGVAGQAGNFTIDIQHQPRYIDLAKCVACGDCAKVCPVIRPDQFNQSLNTCRAAYKLYPQSVPNAYAIEKRGIAPCRDACPAGQRAQGYIALIREGRWQDAMRVIKMDNPFPGICGRICNHRCETACNRSLVDEPINIRALKRFVTDQVYGQPRPEVQPVPITYPDQRVAIIGAGPCGLTAAQDLTHNGFPVTVFEAMPVAGGMLRLGVPEFRLPAEIIEREVQDIIDLGIELRLNTQVNNLDDLFEAGYSAVLIAVGAHEGIRLPITGANLDGVLINTRFLRDVRLGKYQYTNGILHTAEDAPPLGKNVLVLGGGNVAIDVARSLVRLGCIVSMACLEGQNQMPAHPWEVEAALAEGITIYPQRSFERIHGDQSGHVTGVECMHVSSFSFDETGRLNVEKVTDSHHVLPCDTVIFSVGQRAGLAFIPDDAGVGLTTRKTIAVNPNTFAATRPGVFAAGDSVSGTAFVIEAVDSGHKSAQAIIRYLQGDRLEPPSKPELPVVHLEPAEIQDRLLKGEIKLQPRIPLPELPVAQRMNNFVEVESGYDDASAQAEAARCLACGICSECMSCVFACGVNAINHDMPAEVEKIQVGAIILTPGYQVYPAELSEEYGFGRFPNVLTSLQFERILSASGPTLGHIQRPSDQKTPQRIAFLQCVGSRDKDHDYCSSVCCMVSTKEAIMAKEHEQHLDIHIFMMDMRAFSKGYSAYYERAKQVYGIQYTRCRISALRQDPATHDLIVTYQDETGNRHNETFDLVVLSVGMQIPETTRALGGLLDIELDQYGFCLTPGMNPLETSRQGVFAAGPFREPKDIPESVIEASAAAASAACLVSSSRFSLTTQVEFPPERDVSSENPRTGIFVCHCGSNIGGYLDVPSVTEYAASLPNVVHAEHNLYTCAQDSIRHISEQIHEHGLNRVVVASCTPRTHEPLFQDSLRAAGLNPYLFEMANIRNHCSWVHSSDRPAATQKARELVRMAAARAALLEPQTTIQVPVEHTALVIGAGAAGMAAAISLHLQGFPVHLIERSSELGGNLRYILTAPPHITPDHPRHPQMVLQALIQQVKNSPGITLHLNSEILSTRGFTGNFVSTLRSADGARAEISHGATILATGAVEYRGNEYGYGADPRIITQQEFETCLSAQPMDGNKSSLPESVVMIQCVGPAEHTCTRICCASAIKNALVLKERNPEAQVVILYKDIRTYGLQEQLYTQARRNGVLFIRYDTASHPLVSGHGDIDQPLNVQAWDPHLRRLILLQPDTIVLSMPAVPQLDARELAARFKVPADASGFFLEAHVKLRPVDFASDGIFMAGMAHYPKSLDESLIQAQAAAARAVRILSRPTITAGGQVAVVNPALCTGCLTCVRICPFHVPVISSDMVGVGGILGAAQIEAAICQGCGSCAAECPARAIQLMHYTDAQMFAKVNALLEANNAFISLDELTIAEAGHGSLPFGDVL
jgi:heterodisulfide reductase subunit A-like polyferredoxin